MDVAAAAAMAAGARGVVTGFVVAVAGQAPVICDELLESDPPQCGGAQAELGGVAVDALPGLEVSGDVRWTAAPVSLPVRMRDGRLEVER